MATAFSIASSVSGVVKPCFSLVVVKRALVIHAGHHRLDRFAVGERQHADFRAGQELLDDDPRAGRAELRFLHHGRDGFHGAFAVGANEHALAERQTIRLDNDRRTVLPDAYMILPEKLMTQFYRQLSFYSCTVSNFEQYTLSRFIEEGKFETHVNRLRNHDRKKRDLLMEALKRSRLKDRTTVSGEEAGLHFLMHIKTDLPEEQVIANAREKGIRLVPLSSYYYGTAKEKNVYVMNYSSIDIEKADEIMERICVSCE